MWIIGGTMLETNPGSPEYVVAFTVRDYECDLQGIVNNATYLNYLEHARHEFLRCRGVGIPDLAREGVYPVLTRGEIEFRKPLRPGDGFTVHIRAEMTGRARMAFHERILDRSGRLCFAARFEGTVIDSRGRPKIPEGFAEKVFGQVCGTNGFDRFPPTLVEV